MDPQFAAAQQQQPPTRTGYEDTDQPSAPDGDSYSSYPNNQNVAGGATSSSTQSTAPVVNPPFASSATSSAAAAAAAAAQQGSLEIVEHVRQNFGATLAPLLEKEVFTRGLFNSDVDTLYTKFQEAYREIYTKLSRQLDQAALHGAVDGVLFMILSYAHGDNTNTIIRKLRAAFSPEELWYCLLSPSYCQQAVAEVLKGNNSSANNRTSPAPPRLVTRVSPGHQASPQHGHTDMSPAGAARGGVPQTSTTPHSKILGAASSSSAFATPQPTAGHRGGPMSPSTFQIDHDRNGASPLQITTNRAYHVAASASTTPQTRATGASPMQPNVPPPTPQQVNNGPHSSAFNVFSPGTPLSSSSQSHQGGAASSAAGGFSIDNANACGSLSSSFAASAVATHGGSSSMGTPLQSFGSQGGAPSTGARAQVPGSSSQHYHPTATTNHHSLHFGTSAAAHTSAAAAAAASYGRHANNQQHHMPVALDATETDLQLNIREKEVPHGHHHGARSGYPQQHARANNGGQQLNWADDSDVAQARVLTHEQEERIVAEFLNKHGLDHLALGVKKYTLKQLTRWPRDYFENELKLRVCSKAARQQLFEALHPDGVDPPPMTPPPEPRHVVSAAFGGTSIELQRQQQQQQQHHAHLQHQHQHQQHGHQHVAASHHHHPQHAATHGHAQYGREHQPQQHLHHQPQQQQHQYGSSSAYHDPHAQQQHHQHPHHQQQHAHQINPHQQHQQQQYGSAEVQPAASPSASMMVPKPKSVQQLEQQQQQQQQTSYNGAPASQQPQAAAPSGMVPQPRSAAAKTQQQPTGKQAAAPQQQQPIRKAHPKAVLCLTGCRKFNIQEIVNAIRHYAEVMEADFDKVPVTTTQHSRRGGKNSHFGNEATAQLVPDTDVVVARLGDFHRDLLTMKVLKLHGGRSPTVTIAELVLLAADGSPLPASKQPAAMMMQQQQQQVATTAETDKKGKKQAAAVETAEDPSHMSRKEKKKAAAAAAEAEEQHHAEQQATAAKEQPAKESKKDKKKAVYVDSEGHAVEDKYVCRFFATHPKGCVRGNECKFLHLLKAGSPGAPPLVEGMSKLVSGKGVNADAPEDPAVILAAAKKDKKDKAKKDKKEKKEAAAKESAAKGSEDASSTATPIENADEAIITASPAADAKPATTASSPSINGSKRNTPAPEDKPAAERPTPNCETAAPSVSIPQPKSMTSFTSGDDEGAAHTGTGTPTSAQPRRTPKPDANSPDDKASVAIPAPKSATPVVSPTGHDAPGEMPAQPVTVEAKVEKVEPEVKITEKEEQSTPAPAAPKAEEPVQENTEKPSATAAASEPEVKKPQEQKNKVEKEDATAAAPEQQSAVKNDSDDAVKKEEEPVSAPPATNAEE